MKRKIYKYNNFLFSKFDDAHDYMVNCLENRDSIKIRAWESVYATEEYKDEIKKIEDFEVDEIIRGGNHALSMDLFIITETLKIETLTNTDPQSVNELMNLLQIVVNRAYNKDFYK